MPRRFASSDGGRLGGCPKYRRLEHFPEKACPARDAGRAPVFRRKCDQSENLSRIPIQLNPKAV
jgi:hypothetical protein